MLIKLGRCIEVKAELRLSACTTRRCTRAGLAECPHTFPKGMFLGAADRTGSGHVDPAHPEESDASILQTGHVGR